MKRVLLAALLVAAFIFAATQAGFWLAAVPRPSSAKDCAVLVLGYPTKADGTFSPVARFRVEAGVQVYREHQCSKLVQRPESSGTDTLKSQSKVAVLWRQSERLAS